MAVLLELLIVGNAQEITLCIVRSAKDRGKRHGINIGIGSYDEKVAIESNKIR